MPHVLTVAAQATCHAAGVSQQFNVLRIRGLVELVYLPCVFDSSEEASISKVLERRNARRCGFSETIVYPDHLERHSWKRWISRGHCLESDLLHSVFIIHHMSSIAVPAFAFCFLHSCPPRKTPSSTTKCHLSTESPLWTNSPRKKGKK
jgi:hypothetical protein